eukprot:TRINITY_DN13077_c2_g1_i1.p1 TRINITY_DN13077_c2_g1~~TRINITY_DN13077_c2_g1_i1.p1  ORF type:complete len:672 (+),score=118.52 TRINITY_DN13077_c2_g1_i1:47-2062(+)
MESSLAGTETLVAPLVCDASQFMSDMCLETIDDKAGGVILELFLFFWCFLALAMVCDDYLVASLETLCKRWGIREDIAGCTFMAFGSAAPEIIVNAVATIKASEGSTDLGISAIIGSGMIAFMLIPGFCGIFGGAETPLVLKRRPLARDITAYSIGLVELCIFFHDGVVYAYEAAIMIGTYFSYILVVIISPRIRRRFLNKETNVDETPLLEEHTLGQQTPQKGISSVVFRDKYGDEIVFSATGDLLMINNISKGSPEQGITFRLGNQYDIVIADTEADIIIQLEAKGCERIIAKLVRLLDHREIPFQQEWIIGSLVSAFFYTKFLDGTIVERNCDDDTYTVKWDNDGTYTSKLPFADLRPRRDADSSFTDRVDTLRESYTKRISALDSALDMGALSRDAYNTAVSDLKIKMEPTSPVAIKFYNKGVNDDEDASSFASTTFSVTGWRRRWWREDFQDPKPTPWYFKPLMPFVYFWKFVFKYTIPIHEENEDQDLGDADSDAAPHWMEKIYPVTFVLSFVWVAIFSFIISNIATRWADLSGLGSGFVGLLMISVGAEIPDCIQSVTVAKRGYGSMACSNAIGSQNVNVFIGLGLPWLISNIASNEPVEVHKPDTLQVAAFFQCGGVALNLLMTLGIALFLKENKASLGRRKGYCLAAAYFVVVSSYAIYTQV